MANHAQVHTKRLVKIEELEQVLKGINKKVFKDVFIIEPFQYDLSNEKGFYLYFEKDKECIYDAVTLWIRSPRVIEFRHGHSGDFWWWADFLTEELLAKHFNGYIVDDADGIKKYPAPEEIDTFNKYFNRKFISVKTGKNLKGMKLARLFTKRYLYQTIPKDVRKKLGIKL